MATATQTNSTAKYKDREYRLLWHGTTKWGEKAHLEFMDGTKDFWVPMDAIEDIRYSKDAPPSKKQEPAEDPEQNGNDPSGGFGEGIAQEQPDVARGYCYACGQRIED